MRVSWKSPSWVLGVHAATTTRFNPFSRITAIILSWVSCEQVKRFSSTYTTLGSVFAKSATSGTLTTPPMLIPQLQTKTPILEGSLLMSRSSIIVTACVSVLRAGANCSVAAHAAALASMTDWGISFGPVKAPQA